MKKELTLYQSVFDHYHPYIKKKTISYDDKKPEDTKVEISEDGFVSITYIDRGVSGHNGDFYDEHESGWLTFEKSKSDMIRCLKERFNTQLEHLNGLKDHK